MKKIILTAFICVATFKNALCFDNIEKTYTNADGTSVSSKLIKRRWNHDGPDSYYLSAYDENGNKIKSVAHDISYIIQDKSGNVISEYNCYPSRLVYVLDENATVVGLKGCWDCPIYDTFSYTDSGKVLVYGSDGKLKSVYDDLLAYHISNLAKSDGFYGSSTYPGGLGTYIDHDLNLIDSDGRYYERDSKGLIKAVYEQDGTISKYDSAGNLQRRYDSSGNLVWTRRIYTVEEAERLAKKTGNKFTIRYK